MAYYASQSLLKSTLFISIFITTISSFLAVNAIVPANETFKYINQGDFGEYTVEYEANYRVTPIASSIFQLCFYNTTPGLYTLSLRMGHHRSESIMRWVWDINRGNPVHENATLTFGQDGNLVLAESNGKIVWQTNTANKGVVGLYLLENGNIVLHDSKDKFIWQSFDYQTDTLLVGQSLIYPNMITSRASSMDGSEGPYSFGSDKSFMVLYYKTKNYLKPILYYRFDILGPSQTPLTNLTFLAQPETEGATAYEVTIDGYIITRPKYDATFSMLRIDFDGNLRIYTYDTNVDNGAWEVTYTLFGRYNVEEDGENECKLPRRCGSLGVCEDSQCVACPSPQGLLGWSRSCAPPVLPPCKSGSNVKYYKVMGVEYFTYDYKQGNGPMKLADCKAKCDTDCKCVGFFYREESSKCLVVPELGTLVKVSNTSHFGYIKMAK